nr:crossover junction endonuclease EME1 isoform X2 [Gasterosteus aculeatus aculeatus]
MGSYSDSTSDLDEELPVFDFLHRASQSRRGRPDADAAASAAKGQAGARPRAAGVMTISSDSDDDPYVPLAQRLQQRRDDAIGAASSAVSNGEDAERRSPSDPVRAQLLRQNGNPQPERPPGLRGESAVSHSGSSGDPDGADLPRRRQHPDASPARRKPSTRTEEEEEVQASREEAQRRRQAGEGQQRGKEALRQEQERQKAERKALAAAAKALRPEECIKHMVVAVDPALLQLEGGGTLLAALQALGCSCAVEKQAVPRSVSWMRRAPCAQPGGGGGGAAACVPEAHVVMQITVDDFITLVHGYVQEEGRGLCGSGPTLTSWVQQQQRRHVGKLLSLAVVELENHFRSQKSRSQKRLRQALGGEERGAGKGRKRKKSGGDETRPEVSRVDVEEGGGHFQVHTGVAIRFLPTGKNFGHHIAIRTRAVAEAPLKREREKTGFSFHLDGEWAGGQRSDKAGKGLLQVWKRQIQQLNRVSPDMAEAVLAAYPSPQLLAQAYNLCESDGERLALLSDLVIRRGEGVTSTTRRVGPELSKRLFLLMSSREPQRTLDSV